MRSEGWGRAEESFMNKKGRKEEKREEKRMDRVIAKCSYSAIEQKRLHFIFIIVFALVFVVVFMSHVRACIKYSNKYIKWKSFVSS